jgi:hypothetical protein
MTTFTIEDATCEDKFCALQQWWQRHCKSFSEWFLNIESSQQREIILSACPDMPEISAFARETSLTATDVLLPEFSLEGMLASNGRLLVLFLTRRLTPPDLCWKEDIKLLDDLRSRGSLPSFSRGQLSQFDTPFVDPMDPSESISSLSADTSGEKRTLILQLLESFRLIHAEVWLALKIRRTSIAAFIEKLVDQHQKEVAVKPSPTYTSLLQGELAQQAALYDENLEKDS